MTIDDLWWISFIIIIPVTIYLKRVMNKFDGRK
jgi:hypothetical protein